MPGGFKELREAYRNHYIPLAPILVPLSARGHELWPKILLGELLTYYGRFVLCGMFNDMGFVIHRFPIVFLRPDGTVKLYLSVTVELSKCTQNLTKR